MATQLSRKHDCDLPPIPDRLYFKIGDVARICGLETYVLRFWESQFPQLKPNKSGTGQRLYRRRDVELVLEIKRLVHAEGYTLPGARHALESTRRGGGAPEPVTSLPHTSLRLGDGGKAEAVAAAIGHARAELREIAGLLSAPAGRTQRRRPRLTAIAEDSGTLFPS